MKRNCINPKTLFNSTDFGFSQIVQAPSGKFVFFSGQVGWDEHRNIVGKGDLEVQTQKAFENLKIAVAEAGGILENIVYLRMNIVNIDREKAGIVGQVLRKYFGTVNPPASSWIGVMGLASPDFLIEIEAQAVIHTT